MYSENGCADVRRIVTERVAGLNGISSGVVKHAQHSLFALHMLASHFSDHNILKKDSVSFSDELSSDSVAIRGETECAIDRVKS